MFVVGGESLIDLVEEPGGSDGPVRMTAHAGGSPYNCAIALAKLGGETGFLCPVSRDRFGTLLLAPLAAAGAVPLLRERVLAPTTLAVVTLNEKMEAQYAFYRGADRAFTAAELMQALPREPKLFQIGGFCAIEPDDATAWLEVAGAALARGAVLSMDPNIRPSLVEDFSAYRQRLERFFEMVHIIKLSTEDLAALDPAKSIAQHARELLARPNCELVIVTMGAHGSRAFTSAGEASAGIFAPPVFGDTVGAGDSLMAGILTFLADHESLAPERLARLDTQVLEKMLRFGAVVAGLNCAHKGCHPPLRAEVEAVLAQG